MTENLHISFFLIIFAPEFRQSEKQSLKFYGNRADSCRCCEERSEGIV